MLHTIHQILNAAVPHGYYFPSRVSRLLQNPAFTVTRSEHSRPHYLTLIDIILQNGSAQPLTFPYLAIADILEAQNSLKRLEILLKVRGSCDTPIPYSHYLRGTVGRLALGALGLEVHEWQNASSDDTFYTYQGSTKSLDLNILCSAHHLRRALGATYQFGYRSNHFFVIPVDETLIIDFDECLHELSRSLTDFLLDPDNCSLTIGHMGRHPHVEDIVTTLPILQFPLQDKILTGSDSLAIHNLTSAGYNVLPFDTCDEIAQRLNIRVVSSKVGLNRGLAVIIKIKVCVHM